MEILTTSNIMFAIGIITLLFSVWNKIKIPQEELETKQALSEKEMDSKATILAQKEVESKALVLEKQFQWYMEANEKKFADLGRRLDEAFTLATNHTHTVDVKVDKLIETANIVAINIAKLETTINERIPKK
jgi:hypothetical protein